jgi:hypothetical protein
MSIYAYSEELIEQRVSHAKRIQWVMLICGCAVLLGFAISIFYPHAIPIPHSGARDWIFAFLLAIFVHPLINRFRHRRSVSDVLRDSLRATRLEIASGDVTMFYPNGIKREFRIRDIPHAEEASWGGGLFLRSSSRYQWILIPRRLGGYEDIKREISLAGIPIIQTTVPANFEEYLFVLLFLATLFCALVVHDLRILELNLLVAALLVPAGLYFLKSNPNALPKSHARDARIGLLIPPAAAAMGLWMHFHGGW